MAKKKETKKVKKAEPVVTDIVKEYFEKDGVPMVKITEYVGKKPTAVKTIPTTEE
jgi:hypothetical protein